MTTEYIPPQPTQQPSGGGNRGLIIALISIGLVLVLGLVGLGAWLIWGDDDDPVTPTGPSISTPTPAPLPTPGATEPKTPATPNNPQQELTDQDFIDAVEEYFVQDLPDDDLVQLGVATCQSIDANGWDYFINTGIYEIAVQLDISPEDYAYVAGAAIAVYCPEYSQYIE